MQNVDLEQDLAILRKKFRELLTQKVDEKVIKQAHEAMPSGQENAAANQYQKEVGLLRAEVQELSKSLRDCNVKLLQKEQELTNIKNQIEEKDRVGQQTREMESKFSSLRLEMAELKVENQDLKEKNRALTMRNEEIKVEAEMQQVGEMDRKIEELLAKLQAQST